MWIRTADYLLAGAGLLGHIALLAILVRRRLLLRLPAFVMLILFYALRSAWLLTPQLTREWPAAYWVLLYLDPGLQLLVMIAIGLAARGTAKARVGADRLVPALLLMVVVAAAAAWLIGYSAHYSPRNLSLKISMFVSGLWLQVALGLAALLRNHAWHRNRLSLGIAVGFATYAVANILTELIRMHFALSRNVALYTGLALFRVLVYLFCLGGWFVLVWQEQPQASPAFHIAEK